MFKYNTRFPNHQNISSPLIIPNYVPTEQTSEKTQFEKLLESEEEISSQFSEDSGSCSDEESPYEAPQQSNVSRKKENPLPSGQIQDPDRQENPPHDNGPRRFPTTTPINSGVVPNCTCVPKDAPSCSVRRRYLAVHNASLRLRISKLLSILRDAIETDSGLVLHGPGEVPDSRSD